MVTVVPARVDWLEALLEGDAVFAERFGITVVPDWVGFPDALPGTLEAARQAQERVREAEQAARRGLDVMLDKLG